MSNREERYRPVMIVGEFLVEKEQSRDDIYRITKKGCPPARVTVGVIEKALKDAYESEF